MLFHSTEFLFCFLPLSLLGYWWLRERGGMQAAFAWLTLASCVFYAWWAWPYLGLLLATIGGNFLIGLRLQQRHERSVLVAGITANLLLLGYFKYSGFLLDSLSRLMDASWTAPDILLPLAISFFTFQQIAYLVDCYRARASEQSLLRYSLFVAFFPQLIAGPIVHHAHLLPQFRRRLSNRLLRKRMGVGLSIFLLGLAKKVVLADQFGVYADAGFDAAASGVSLTLVAAWAAALAYTFQLYFDFSGYSDMAFGLAFLFGIRLPFNFNSPYQALSISDFWRRWHMTLSGFLRDYLYIPLGGNRRGVMRRRINLMLTMLLGGLWHGAGWNFVIWGGLHGLYLAVHQWWQSRGWCSATPLYRVASWALTFIAVVWAWVLFRATDLQAAELIYRGMLGLNGVALPAQLLDAVPVLSGWAFSMPHVIGLGTGSVMSALEHLLLILLGLIICVSVPNLYKLRESTRLLLVICSFYLVLQKVLFSADQSAFLYFQF